MQTFGIIHLEGRDYVVMVRPAKHGVNIKLASHQDVQPKRIGWFDGENTAVHLQANPDVLAQFLNGEAVSL